MFRKFDKKVDDRNEDPRKSFSSSQCFLNFDECGVENIQSNDRRIG